VTDPLEEKIMRQNQARNRWTIFTRRFALAVAAAVLVLMGASAASAGCFDPNAPHPNKPYGVPGAQDQQGEYGQPTIVGLWHVIYTASNGAAFNETMKMWHSDGIEFENAFLPPAGGNICYGVWKETAPRTVKLHHIGLMFNPDGTLKAIFTIDEVNEVSEDNKTYKGTFDFKVWNEDETAVVQEVKGTEVATRITVN
jgi:hypothetical protein